MNRFLAVIVALLMGGTVTTTASAASFNYDVLTFVRVDTCEFAVVEDGPALFSDARERSARSAVDDRPVSTTPTRSLVATKAGAAEVAPTAAKASAQVDTAATTPSLSMRMQLRKADCVPSPMRLRKQICRVCRLRSSGPCLQIAVFQA